MNRRYEFWIGTYAAAGLLILILDGRTALAGAYEGVELCLKTLVPTLFPFFFLSNILSSSLSRKRIKLLRPLGRLLRIPDGAEYILLTGLLGGYPVGAQCISNAYEAGTLSHQDARRMLAFCNNCGPAFVFGMAGALFPDPWTAWFLFGIHFICAGLVGFFLPGNAGKCLPNPSSFSSPVRALQQSIRSIAGVCGWVILFKVLLSFMERWFLWYFAAELQIAVTGFFELSNGCVRLAAVKDPQLRFVLCAAFLGFGGLCVTMQTWFAAGNVDKRLYFPGKLLHSTLSMMLACLVCGSIWFLLPAVLSVILVIFLRKTEKRCRNPQLLVV